VFSRLGNLGWFRNLEAGRERGRTFREQALEYEQGTFMSVSSTKEKRHLHELVERLPEDQINPALSYLNFLCADPVLRSLLNAPPDDEPYTDEQRKRGDDAEASIARGEGISHEEILREFGS
jgi:hypothetical protein